MFNLSQTYDKILSLYDLVENIECEIQKREKEVNSVKKEKLLRTLYINLNKSIDVILMQYIKLLIDKNNSDLKNKINSELNNIINTIAICKNRIYYLYKR